jgi:hypothetical protein
VTTGASADLSGALSDETGTGVAVFNADPSILGVRLWGDSNQTNLFRFNANGSIHSNAVGTIQFKSGGGQFGGGTTDLAPGSGGVIATNFVRSYTGTFTNALTLNGATVMTNRVGIYNTIWIPAEWFTATTTNGATANLYTVTGADNLTKPCFDFADSVTNRIGYSLFLPEQWNYGTVKAKVSWVNTSGTGNVQWWVMGGAVADAGAMGATYGTPQSVTDAAQSANNFALSGATPSITIGGTPANGKMVSLQVYRYADAGNGTDTFSGTAKFLGLWLQYQESSTEPSAW